MTLRMMAFLFGCSSGRYHIATKSVVAGITSASKPPRKKRQTNRVAKLCVAAMQISATPQQNTFRAKKVTTGNLDINQQM
jgi:hypothetical protein